MKVVIYGASVTAQKGNAGYFESLEHIKPDTVELIRIPYGASHLHFAGIAMLQKVINEQPDVCILDWVTPSTKVFPQGIVDKINSILISNGIHPIWLLLPRIDDPSSLRECCNQIRQSASAKVSVVSFVESEFNEPDLSKILRDVVHTNSSGAEKYSQFILNIIDNVNLTLKKAEIPQLAPYISQCEGTINKDSKLIIEVTVEEVSSLKLFLFGRIGPRSPIINLALIGSEGCEKTTMKNVVDPWCYYERDMLLDTPSFEKLSKGNYRIEVSLQNSDPFENVRTLKPIDEEFKLQSHLERFLNISEISVDGSVKVRSINYAI
ncbi:hypothetical protein [Alteromonas stellipolaris]|uniref:hypothetical protein n=1 Tax=Alteromonas stellipolaris TaxID=233316 RepID=UPI002734326E|nr:hypothetical protein [Alteromonas stellipolaris]MDP2597664.1 hypothetical protein [Alteromonas stellipolaris]